MKLRQIPRTVDQLVRRRVEKSRRMIELFEPERQRRNASLATIRQQFRQHGGTIPRVFQPPRVRPIGQVDGLLHALTVEVAIRKRVERVTGQLATSKSFRESAHLA